MEDKKIVEMFFSRNEDAIRQTALKYGNRLRRLSFGITADEGLSEECENDTYLKLWNSIPPYNPGNHLFSFAARITRHISIDRCRERTAAKRNYPVTELTEELENSISSNENVESGIDAEELGKAISVFLRSQSKEKRIIFMRRYFYSDSISYIAEKMKISESKVKTTLFRMRNDLRNYLITEGYIL